jgi:hypothetical protein
MHLSVPTFPYHPDIIYLGRQNDLESRGLPFTSKDPQYIYAEVRDIYNQNLHGKLSYTAFNNTNNKKILSGTINMTLFNGIPTNGTWRGEIPRLPKVNNPYTVLYNATFKDDLNYSFTMPGPYYNHNDYTGNDYNFVNGQGYNVTSRYIEVIRVQGQFKNETSFVAAVSDYRTNVPYDVMLHYKLISFSHQSRWPIG